MELPDGEPGDLPIRDLGVGGDREQGPVPPTEEPADPAVGGQQPHRQRDLVGVDRWPGRHRRAGRIRVDGKLVTGDPVGVRDRGEPPAVGGRRSRAPCGEPGKGSGICGQRGVEITTLIGTFYPLGSSGRRNTHA